MYYINSISLNFGDRVLFDGITFMIGKKERIGLIGRNGAGKSTLLKIINDSMSPDEGNIQLPSNTTIGYLKQAFHLNESKSILEETMSTFEEVLTIQKQMDEINTKLAERTDYESEGYGRLLQKLSEISAQLEHHDIDNLEPQTVKILTGLGFKNKQLKDLVSTLSGGWKMRIELAKLLLKTPDLLLLDEPTNHLDIESIIWLENYLREYPNIVILISHDIQFMDNVANRILEIELGRLYDFKGTYKKYVIEKAQQSEIRKSAFENQQKVIAEKERTITRFMAKATKTKMAQSMKKQLEKMERIEILPEDASGMKIRFGEVPRSGRDVVDIKLLSKAYGDNQVITNASLKIERGEKVAFVGQNGQGKTTLAKIIVGTLDPTSGEAVMGHNSVISYYAQNQSDLVDDKKTLLQVMEDKAPEDKRTKVRSILGSFLFSGEDVDKKVSVLSGGEKARLALATMVMFPCNLLVMDEPTNHLDIISKEILKDAIINYEGTLIVVSHDRDFLSGMTDKVIEFRDQKLTTYLGDINYYLEKRNLDNMREVEMQKSQMSRLAPKSFEKIESGLSRDEEKKLKRKIQYCERDIDKLETQLKEIGELLAQSEFYMKPEFIDTNKKFTDLQTQLESKMEEWENLIEKVG